MSYKDLLDVILALRDDIWLQWGWVVAVNVALIGWLIQRHGLYELSEKTVATIAYVIFLLLIYGGMDDVYKKLDMSTNDLYAYNKHYIENNKEDYIPISEGIVQHYVERSPKYCASLSDKSDCKPYSENFHITKMALLLCLLQNMVLFWFDPIWKKSRQIKKQVATP